MRPRVQPQLMFEVGVSHTASARSVDSERRRPSDGRLRRERAGADGQQCERDRAHRVLRLAGQSSNGGASGSLLGRRERVILHPPNDDSRRRGSSLQVRGIKSKYGRRRRDGRVVETETLQRQQSRREPESGRDISAMPNQEEAASVAGGAIG